MKYGEDSEQAAAHDAASSDAPTRRRVSQSILEHGPSTAVELADRLDLTPSGIRRHLDHLVKEGTLTTRPQRSFGPRRRGRPAQVYLLTPSGRELFTHAYDDIANDVLDYLAAEGGSDAVLAFARHRWSKYLDRYRELLAAAPSDERIELLASVLTDDGFPSSVVVGEAGDQICQHHCPVVNVAGRHPELCEAETEMFSELLGSHVQRLATIAHGDAVCTTHVPRAPMSTGTEGSKKHRKGWLDDDH